MITEAKKWPSKLQIKVLELQVKTLEQGIIALAAEVSGLRRLFMALNDKVDSKSTAANASNVMDGTSIMDVVKGAE